MCMSDTIRTLRLNANLTQKTVGAAIGVDQSTISQWEKGLTLPSRDKIPRLAAFFGVTEQTFFHGLDDSHMASPAEDDDSIHKKDSPTAALTPEGNEDTPYLRELIATLSNTRLLETDSLKALPIATVPIVTLGRVHAGAFSEEDIIGHTIEVPSTLLDNHPHAQAVVVEGDCMSRVAPDGSIAVFDPTLQPENGRIVIVETDDHQALMRRWFKGSHKLMLTSDSYQPYDDIVVDESQPIRVIGTVIHVIIPPELL